MDKFKSASKASDSKLIAPEPTQQTAPQEKASASGSTSKRWLWAASLCSLVGVASLSYVLVTDHMRISNLQEQIAQRRMGAERVAQHVMATQVHGSSSSASYHSSSASYTSATYGNSGYYSASYQATNQELYDPVEDHIDIVEFSESLDATLRFVIDKVILVGQNVAQSSAHLALMQSTVDVMLEDNESLKYDVIALDSTESQVTWKFTNTQNNVQNFEDRVQGVKNGKGVNLQTRIGNLESGAYQVAVDVDSIKSS